MKTLSKFLVLLFAISLTSVGCFAGEDGSDVMETAEYVEYLNPEQIIADELPAFIEFLQPIAEAFYGLFLSIASNGWWSLAIMAGVLLLVAVVIYLLRRADSDYERAWIYYLIYLLALVPAVGVLMASVEGDRLLGEGQTIMHEWLLFMMALVPGALMIFAGWGIRQCGMICGLFKKNFNYNMGQILLFPVWIFLVYMFWDAAFAPLIDWSAGFAPHDGGFWRYLLTLVLGFSIVFVVYTIWFVVFESCLKTAGNTIIHIYSFVLWWVMVQVGYNWLYANFNGFGYFVMLCLCALIMWIIVIGVGEQILTTRCPMCHDFNGVEVRNTDNGIEYKIEGGWKSISSDDVPDSGKITNARKHVLTTIAVHKWTTEHACSYCGCTWSLSHSEEVGRKEKVMEIRWTKVKERS